MHLGSLVLAASLGVGLTALTVSTLQPERWLTSSQVKAVQASVFEAMSLNMMDTIATTGCIRVPANTSVAHLIEKTWLAKDIEKQYPWQISTQYMTLGYGEIARLSLTLTAKTNEASEKLKQAAQQVTDPWRFEPGTRSLTIYRTQAFVRSEYDEANFDFQTGCFVPGGED
ncbi:hypothetical protein [Vibrio jasicida]|uniref:hypothetical protein n=1 Tax=Vibrio jasicida TaxID=766224 RepID=UPI0005ED7D4C|nr:hypothetical protein [Vibrio jasicida]